MAAPYATPVREGDSALVRVLEACIETLRAENEILRRRLAAAEARRERPRRRKGRSPSFRPSCDSGRGRPPLAMATRGMDEARRRRALATCHKNRLVRRRLLRLRLLGRRFSSTTKRTSAYHRISAARLRRLVNRGLWRYIGRASS
jgi:hypothetical protein